MGKTDGAADGKFDRKIFQKILCVIFIAKNRTSQKVRVQLTFPSSILAAEEINPLNAKLNPICHLLALLGVHFLHVSRIRVKSLTLRLLMSYIYIYIWSTYS